MTVIFTAGWQGCHNLSSRAWNYLLYHIPVDDCFCYGFLYVCRKGHSVVGMRVDCYSSSRSSSSYILSFLFIYLFIFTASVSFLARYLNLGVQPLWSLLFFSVRQSTRVCKWETCERLRSEVGACGHWLCMLVCGFHTWQKLFLFKQHSR